MSVMTVSTCDFEVVTGRCEALRERAAANDARFEETAMSAGERVWRVGKYKGVKLRAVPPDVLAWFAAWAPGKYDEDCKDCARWLEWLYLHPDQAVWPVKGKGESRKRRRNKQANLPRGCWRPKGKYFGTRLGEVPTWYLASWLKGEVQMEVLRELVLAELRRRREEVVYRDLGDGRFRVEVVLAEDREDWEAEPSGFVSHLDDKGRKAGGWYFTRMARLADLDELAAQDCGLLPAGVGRAKEDRMRVEEAWQFDRKERRLVRCLRTLERCKEGYAGASCVRLYDGVLACCHEAEGGCDLSRLLVLGRLACRFLRQLRRLVTAAEAQALAGLWWSAFRQRLDLLARGEETLGGRAAFVISCRRVRKLR